MPQARFETLRDTEADLSSVAALIGEPARAAMLTALMDGLALPAGELAELAGVSPQTASSHLQKLLEGQMLSVETHGRHRYYRISNPAVAQALESLMVLAPLRSRQRQLPNEAMCYARTCYDHLAGWLGVLLCQTMLEHGWLEPNHSNFGGLKYQITAMGREKLESFGVPVNDILCAKNPARACLDWTERRHHLGGVLGRVITTRMLELHWLVRQPSSRALRVTSAGRTGLQQHFGMRF
jgi:DNA-binding transcriptional ArsR family regulator